MVPENRYWRPGPILPLNIAPKMATTAAGLIGMLNNAGVRNARVERREKPVLDCGWWINGIFAGASAREARTAIRVDAEQFRPQNRPRRVKRWVLRRVK